MRDVPVPIQPPKPTIKGVPSKKAMIEYENMKEKSEAFRYAPIPFPPEIVLRPVALPYEGDLPSNYMELYEEYFRGLRTAHSVQQLREGDYHCNEYVSIVVMFYNNI